MAGLPPTQNDSIRALETLIDQEQEKARAPPDSPSKAKSGKTVASAPVGIPGRSVEPSASMASSVPQNISKLSAASHHSGGGGNPSLLSSSLPPDVKAYRSQLHGWADEGGAGGSVEAPAPSPMSPTSSRKSAAAAVPVTPSSVITSTMDRAVAEPLPTPPMPKPALAVSPLTAPPMHGRSSSPSEAPPSPVIPEMSSLSLSSVIPPTRVSAVAGVVTAGTPRLDTGPGSSAPGASPSAPERKKKPSKQERKAAKREAYLAAKAAKAAKAASAAPGNGVAGAGGQGSGVGAVPAAAAAGAPGAGMLSVGGGERDDDAASSVSARSADTMKDSGTGAGGAGAGKRKDIAKKKPQTAKQRQIQFDDPKARAKMQKNQILRRTAAQRQHPLFSHLPQYDRETSLSLNVGFSASEKIHPAVLHLGLKIAEGSIRGANARCVAMLTAFKTVVRQMQTPPDKLLSRELESALKPMIQFLVDCRPLSISMGNAIKWLKREIAGVSPTLTESEQRTAIVDAIDTFINERVVFAGSVIAQYAVEKISDGDVLLTYGCSSSVERVIRRAHELNRDFRVIIVDSRPHYNGKELLRRLVGIGVACTYCTINAVSYIMSEATKVFLGAASMLSNGTLYSSAGTSIVAMMAREYNVPVLVCCETYKFCERVQLDSITSNELQDPDDLIDLGANREPLMSDWRDVQPLKLLRLAYDITPIELLVVVITEVGIIPPTSVPVIIREYRKETQA